jgi:maleate isomerase
MDVAFTSWRGVVGVVKPTMRPGSLEEFIRLLPEGIGVIPMFLGIREGTVSEFKSVLDAVESKVKELAELEVDLIHPEGAPPFMVQGYDAEKALTKKWEEAYGVPIVTAPQTQIEAMHVLDIHRFVGVTYFTGEINDMFAKYFADAGFEPMAMEGIDVPFNEVQRLSSFEVYAHTKKAFVRNPGVDGIYMLGSGWRTLDIIETLEEDLQVPVVHPVPARVWAVQRRLHVHQPVLGYGRLLEELP